MLRTRDFLLFLLTVAFLVTGIVSAIDSKTNNKPWYSFNFTEGDNKYEAWLPERAELNREERLSAMREKVSHIDIDANLASLISATEENDEDKPVEEKPNHETMVGEIKKCTDFSMLDPVWSPANLKFDVVEGARIVYREDMSSSTLSSQTIVLQLPLRSVPFGDSQCLKTSVVAVALDGSLIHNEDYTAYKVFGAETLIGYALDGFPIYGLNSTETDVCGGVVDNGQYKYYLSSEREGMIGCFASTPVSF